MLLTLEHCFAVRYCLTRGLPEPIEKLEGLLAREYAPGNGSRIARAILAEADEPAA